MPQVLEGVCFQEAAISEIAIPDSVQHIGESGFYCCRSVERVQFSENSSLTEICAKAFAYSKLCDFRMPKSVLSVGQMGSGGQIFSTAQELVE